MFRRALLAFELVVFLGLGAAGCKQGNGGRCEVDSDCASGICSVNGAGLGGFCQGDDEPTPTNDASSGADAPVDGPADDAAPDAGSPADAGADAGAEVGTLPDADGDEGGAQADADDDAGGDAPALPQG